MSLDTCTVKNSPPPSSERLTGRVKWFNNKAGFGFITVTDGPRSGSDIFVHHTAVSVESQQYKYLVQGEYVEFDLVSVSSGQHEFQASSVSGIKGGKLMCESRHELKVARSEYKSTKQVDESETKMPRQRQTRETREARPRTEGRKQPSREPRAEGDKKEWTLVKRSDKNTNAPRRSNNQQRPSKPAST